MGSKGGLTWEGKDRLALPWLSSSTFQKFRYYKLIWPHYTSIYVNEYVDRRFSEMEA